MTVNKSGPRWAYMLLGFGLLVTIIVYLPGLHGGFLFDDYPNIVDNYGVQPQSASVPSLVGAALSSPASEFRRPLASLSFAANFLASGLNPYWMKLTNLAIHLLNGVLIFLLAQKLLATNCVERQLKASFPPSPRTFPDQNPLLREKMVAKQAGLTAALIATGWMLLPINLTGVLYVVQRMESMANLFVLLGLIGYVAGRRRMLDSNQFTAYCPPASASVQKEKSLETVALASHLQTDEYRDSSSTRRGGSQRGGFGLCAISITIPTALGILAKETAAMLPLYALIIEWALFSVRTPTGTRDYRIVTLFLTVLVLPMMVGLAWLLPGLLKPETWATRDFTLYTRLLSEARIVVDYISWTLLPIPNDLSFYHDNFDISTGLLSPWTTLLSILTLSCLVIFAIWLRPHRPLVALGIMLFLGCQLLTGTIIPLELIYEHRNYFASFGLMLALVPFLMGFAPEFLSSKPKFTLPRYVLLGGLLLLWAGETTMTAAAWGNPLRLAETLAARAPNSPRASYELGRTYITHSNYDPSSPFTKMAYAPLEHAATLPGASIMPEQALIFMSSRMRLPLKDVWWDNLTAKLKAHKPGVQDESSLGALTQCDRERHCELPNNRMTAAYLAAFSHPDPSARLLAMYGDYAWNSLNDHQLGLRMTDAAVAKAPNEPAYRVTQVRMMVDMGHMQEAQAAIKKLQALNIGGRLDTQLTELQKLPRMR